MGEKNEEWISQVRETSLWLENICIELDIQKLSF